jgi:hypothetical protein
MFCGRKKSCQTYCTPLYASDQAWIIYMRANVLIAKPIHTGELVNSRATSARCMPSNAIAGVAASFVSTLAFLPVTGCDQGGFYSTGAQAGDICAVARACIQLCPSPANAWFLTAGVTTDCVPIYQPAAAAEARFLARLRDGQQRHTGSNSLIEPRKLSDASKQASVGDVTSLEGRTGADVVTTDETGRLQLSQESRGWLRDELDAEIRARTQQKIMDAWQSLE